MSVRLLPRHAVQRGENNLVREVDDSPELGVVDAERASVFPEVRDDLGVGHEQLKRTLRACLAVYLRGEGLRKTVHLVVGELRNVAALGTRRRGGHLRQGGLQARKERSKKRVGPFCVEVRVQVGERRRVGDGQRDNGKGDRGRLVRRTRGRERGERGAVGGEHERVRGVQSARVRGRHLGGEGGHGRGVGHRRRGFGRRDSQEVSGE